MGTARKKAKDKGTRRKRRLAGGRTGADWGEGEGAYG